MQTGIQRTYIEWLFIYYILVPRASRPRASSQFSTSDRVKMALGTRMWEVEKK
jgi:hypothetical protein